MKVSGSLLFVCQRNPFTGNKGDQIIVANRIRYLSLVYDRIFILVCGNLFTSLLYEFRDNKCMLILNESCFYRFFFKMGNGIIKGFSFQRSLFNCSSSLLRALYYINEDSKCDIINVLFMTCRTVPSLDYLRICESIISNVRYAVDFIDSLSLQFKRRSCLSPWNILLAIESKRLSSDELDISSRIKSSFVSAIDRNHVVCLARTQLHRSTSYNMHVNPNGVNSRLYCMYPRNGLDIRLKKYTYVGFLGNLDYKPNFSAVKSFILDVLPLIETPICFLIAGPTKKKNIHRLLKRACAEYSHVVIYQGFVENKFDFFDQIDIFVAPMTEGSGIQNKVLEACSYGLPVVTTPLAAQPLEDIKGLFISTKNNTTSFAMKLSEVLTLDSSSLWDSAATSQRCSKHYSWYNSAMNTALLYQS